MLKVLRGDSTGEMELSGHRSDLMSLAQELMSGQGEIRLEKVSNPSPYSRSLLRIKYRQASGKITISSLGGNEYLDIQGGLEPLSLLADNIQSFALEADQDDHLHVDYFPEHEYLASGSESLVVAIDSDAHPRP